MLWIFCKWIQSAPYYIIDLCKMWLYLLSWWRHLKETFSALLALCAGISPVTGEFPTQRPVTRNFDVFLDLRLKERLSKQSWGCWFETLLCPLWRHCNVIHFAVPIFNSYSPQIVKLRNSTLPGSQCNIWFVGYTVVVGKGYMSWRWLNRP